jgi:hypothetical protein
MKSHCTVDIARFKTWLTPWVWRQAHQTRQGRENAERWTLHRIVMVLALMTFTTGDSEAERFAAARAYYVATHQHEQRPGKCFSGFKKALAKVPLPVLHALFAAVRQCMSTFLRYWHGFIVMACDGSRLECPRSRQLEKRLKSCGKDDSAPMLQVAALVLLPIGLLWSWTVGPGTASEHDQLRQLLPTLPRGTLLVADACYLGYDLYTDILQAKADFLARMSSRAHLYTEQRQRLNRYREGWVYHWPKDAQKAGRPPLRLRLICVRARKRVDVWLLTSVDETRLTAAQAAEIYRARWQIEGVFRTYKRTLPKVKLWSRTQTLVYREAEVSLLALQLLQAETIGRVPSGPAVVRPPKSPRQTLLGLRGEITTTIGAKLGPRQQAWYRARLQRVGCSGSRKRVRRAWPRRKDHTPPKPPKLRVMPRALKSKMRRLLDDQKVGVR